MCASPKTILEANGVQGKVSVEFHQVGDFYSHSIWLQTVQERIQVFESFEEPSLPNLACFTQLHQQGQTLFLTGANGPCHWSMSVQLGVWRYSDSEKQVPSKGFFPFEDRYGLNAPENLRSDREQQFLFFDVACRLKEKVANLGIEYVKPGEILCPDTGDNFCFVMRTYCPGKFLMGVGVSADSLMNSTPSPHCLMSFQSPEKLRVCDLNFPIKKYPATVQWSYGVWPM